jgi:16S rRNA (guanine966-N2)-methyltransferase
VSSLRVIAGSAKGMKLKAPRGFKTRPTSDRVKEALFNLLSPHIINSTFFDLYAGSGAIGIEALSRGATCSVFVERDRTSLLLIKDNLAKAGFMDRAILYGADVKQTMNRLPGDEKADIVFLDPPYDDLGFTEVIEIIYRKKLIGITGLIIVEHAHKSGQWIAQFKHTRTRRYGDTALTIIRADQGMESKDHH